MAYTWPLQLYYHEYQALEKFLSSAKIQQIGSLGSCVDRRLLLSAHPWQLDCILSSEMIKGTGLPIQISRVSLGRVATTAGRILIGSQVVQLCVRGNYAMHFYNQMYEYVVIHDVHAVTYFAAS